VDLTVCPAGIPFRLALVGALADAGVKVATAAQMEALGGETLVVTADVAKEAGRPQFGSPG